jgi:hypothetical protein
VSLRDLASVGPTVVADLRRLGVEHPDELVGRDAFELYDALCAATGERQDPCVIDVFLAVIDQASGNPPAPWQAYTPERRRLAFLRESGAVAVRHNSHEDLVPHLKGTRDLLRGWGAREALCDAGLFHSIYGTEYFTTATLGSDRRADVRAVIGAEAEELVWLWCFGRRTSLAENLERDGDYRIQDRRTQEWLPIEGQQFDDLVDLWIADTLEQLDRVREREVPVAKGLMRYRERALPAARAALERRVASL